MGIMLTVWYIKTGSFTPYKAIGFLGGFIMTLGFLTLTLGIVADMLSWVIELEEEILYRLRNNQWVANGPY